MNSVQTFLEQTNQAFNKLNPGVAGINGYRSLYDFVLQHGQSWGPRIKRLPAGIPRGKLGDCFRNSAIVALAHPQWIYCEGYASSIIPIAHAWCVDRSGRVLDNTWSYRKEIEYFGIPFRADYLRKSLLSNKSYGLIDQWQMGFPLLKHDPQQWKYYAPSRSTPQVNGPDQRAP